MPINTCVVAYESPTILDRLLAVQAIGSTVASHASVIHRLLWRKLYVLQPIGNLEHKQRVLSAGKSRIKTRLTDNIPVD